MQLIFLAVIGGMMLVALGYQQAGWFGGVKEEPSGRSVSLDELRAEYAEEVGDGGSVELRSQEEIERFLEQHDDDGALTIGDLDDFADQPPPSMAPFEDDPVLLELAASRDRTAGEEDLDVVTDESIIYLLHRALARPDETRSGQPVLTSRRDRVTERLLAEPDRYRGQLVEIVGNLVRQERDKSPVQFRALPDDHESGLERTFRSYVYASESPKDSFFLVYSSKPQDLEHLTGVTFRGYFCRLYTNDVEVNGELYKGTIPILVGLEHSLLPSAPPAAPSILYLLPVAIILPLVAGAFIFVLTRRTNRTFESRREKARSAVKSGDESAGSKASAADSTSTED